MRWWLEHKFRMIQNNFRDIDGNLDVEEEICMLKKLHANVVEVGCGGISAFTPTSLDSQRKSRWLDETMFGRLVERCHQEGIRVIARFDFSKTHKDYVNEHPDWFSKSIDGNLIQYNDTLATCINGPYQQEETLRILREVLEKFPIDGVFFNMFGYQIYDYDNKYVGICQCKSCKERFKRMFGRELPTVESESDPAYIDYKKFKEYTINDILEKIYNTIHEISPDIALSTYSTHFVDIVRSESNSAVDRPYPFWIYSGSDNTATIEDTFENKVASNCAINAVDIPYRFMGVSKHLNRIRLLQNMANGSNLDWCIVGAFPDYPDRANYSSVEEVFAFQEQYQELFDSICHDSKVLIVQTNPMYDGTYNSEFRGIFRMLKEWHIPFDVVLKSHLQEAAEHADQYDLIILPGVEDIDCKEFENVLIRKDIAVLGTGITFRNNKELMRKVFGCSIEGIIQVPRGSYLCTKPKDIFLSFKERDWVYLDKEFAVINSTNTKVLPYVGAASYGPPERCFGHEIKEMSGAICNGKHMYIPWMPGTLFYQHGYTDFRDIVYDLLEHTGCLHKPFETNAHPYIEMFFNACGDGQYLLQLINLSGFNGTTVEKPIVQHGISIRFNDIVPSKIYALNKNGKKRIGAGQNLNLPPLDTYQAYHIIV